MITSSGCEGSFRFHAEPVEGPPHPPAGGGGSRMLRGLMLRMKKISSFFNVFKIFAKIFVHNEIY